MRIAVGNSSLINDDELVARARIAHFEIATGVP